MMRPEMFNKTKRLELSTDESNPPVKQEKDKAVNFLFADPHGDQLMVCQYNARKEEALYFDVYCYDIPARRWHQYENVGEPPLLDDEPTFATFFMRNVDDPVEGKSCRIYFVSNNPFRVHWCLMPKVELAARSPALHWTELTCEQPKPDPENIKITYNIKPGFPCQGTHTDGNFYFIANVLEHKTTRLAAYKVEVDETVAKLEYLSTEPSGVTFEYIQGVLHGNELMVFASQDTSFRSILAFDIIERSWSRHTLTAGERSFPVDRGGFSVAKSNCGKFAVLSGGFKIGKQPTLGQRAQNELEYKQVWLLDLDTKKWDLFPHPLPAAAFRHSVVFSPENHMYLFRGLMDNSMYWLDLNPHQTPPKQKTPDSDEPVKKMPKSVEEDSGAAGTSK